MWILDDSGLMTVPAGMPEATVLKLATSKVHKDIGEEYLVDTFKLTDTCYAVHLYLDLEKYGIL